MTAPLPTAVGLYSIGLRGTDFATLMDLAASHAVPFLHLRGGPKGYDLVHRSAATLAAWRRRLDEGPPVSVVTSDLDLGDFLDPHTAHSLKSRDELGRLAEAARGLGAGAVRLLARRVPVGVEWERLALPDPRRELGVGVLAELHDPAWFGPGRSRELHVFADRTPGFALLLDGAQIGRAADELTGSGLGAELTGLASLTSVAHLSDTGAGLHGEGHRLLAGAVRAAVNQGRAVQIAVEWTGGDRGPDRCFAAYRQASGWWERHCGAEHRARPT